MVYGLTICLLVVHVCTHSYFTYIYNNTQWYFLLILSNPTKGFCQVKKNAKIWIKLGCGWVGQAPTQIFLKYCVFLCCFFRCTCFKKKKKNGYLLSGQSEFFSDIWNFFNLTRLLIHTRLCALWMSSECYVAVLYIELPRNIRFLA